MEVLERKPSLIDEGEIIELRILELLESDPRWWTIEEVSSSLGLSKATIQKYLGSIKVRLAFFSEMDVSIETSTSKGIYFQRASSFNIQILYTQILKELLAFSIFNSFLYSEHFSIIKLSSENYVSLASIRRKYKSFNTYFDGLDLSIKKDIFSGDEKQIRWFFSEFYWQIFKGTEWPFRLISREFMNKVVEKIQDFFNIELIPEVKEEMLYWMTINSIRHIKGYVIAEDLEIQKYTSNNPLFLPFIEILREIFPNDAKNNKPGALAEGEYLFLLVSALPVMEKNVEYAQLIYQAHKRGETIIYEITLEWLRHYEYIFGSINVEKKRQELVNKLLRIHSFSYLYHIGEAIFVKKNYVNEIIEHHPHFYERMLKIYDILNEKYKTITKNKTYLLENYVLLSMEHFVINQFEKTVRISLNFSKGIIYEEVVRGKILAYFYGKYKIEFVTNQQTRDILITDLPYILKEVDCTIISVQLKLTKRDFQNIEEAILLYN